VRILAMSCENIDKAVRHHERTYKANSIRYTQRQYPGIALQKLRIVAGNTIMLGLEFVGADIVVAISNSTGRKTDKFRAFDLTPQPASLVTAPLIAECYANLECRVADTRMVNRYNFFVLEVVKAWIDPSIRDPRTLHHRGRGAFMTAGETIKLPSRMK
jgi:hypothetical protein